MASTRKTTHSPIGSPIHGAASGGYAWEGWGAAILPDGMVAAWTLDEPSGYDRGEIGSRHDLAETGTVKLASGPDSELSGADGWGNNSYLQTPGSSRFPTGEKAWQVSMWVYLTSKGSDQVAIMHGNRSEDDGGFEMGYDQGNDRIYLGVPFSGSGFQTNLFANSFGSPPTDAWLFVLFGWDETDIFISVTSNGSASPNSKDTTTPDNVNETSSTRPLRVGRRTDVNLPFQGRISRIAWWERLMTSEEEQAYLDRDDIFAEHRFSFSAPSLGDLAFTKNALTLDGVDAADMESINSERYDAKVNASAGTWRDTVREPDKSMPLDDGSGNYVAFFSGYNSGAASGNQRKVGRAIASSQTGSWSIDNGTGTPVNPVQLDAGGDMSGEDPYVAKNVDGTIYRDSNGYAYLYCENDPTSATIVYRTQSSDLSDGWESLGSISSGGLSPIVVHSGTQFVGLFEFIPSGAGSEETRVLTSSDGINFTEQKTVVPEGIDGEQIDVVDDVIKVGDIWYLTYHTAGGRPDLATIDAADPDDWGSATFTIVQTSIASAGPVMFASDGDGVVMFAQLERHISFATMDLAGSGPWLILRDGGTELQTIDVTGTAPNETLQLRNVETSGGPYHCAVASVNSVLPKGGGWKLSFDLEASAGGTSDLRYFNLSLGEGSPEENEDVYYTWDTSDGITVHLDNDDGTDNVELIVTGNGNVGSPPSPDDTASVSAGDLTSSSTWEISYDGRTFRVKRAGSEILSAEGLQLSDWRVMFDQHNMGGEGGILKLQNLTVGAL